MNRFTTLLILTILVSACKKENDNQNSGPQTPYTPTSNYPFFQATVNNQALSLAASSDDNGYTWDAYPGDVDDETFVAYAAFLGNPDASVTEKGAAISFGHFQHSSSVYNAQTFNADMSTLTSSFSSGTVEQPGIEIIYNDGAQNFWSSKYGDQAGSTVVITSNQPATPKYGLARRFVSGTISCKLYNMFTPGEPILLTNGYFKCYVAEMQ